MAIEKPLVSGPFPEEMEGTVEVETEEEPDLSIGVLNPDAVSIETEDGGVIIEFDPRSEDEDADGQAHNANLAEFMEEGDLQNLATDLVGLFDSDRMSRKDWEMTYIKGLDLLGLKIEDRTQPFPGACGVFHPVLTESIIRYQAHSMMETFPASGPVKTQVIGEINTEKEEQAVRVQNEMNFQVTEVMTDYRSEHEQLLFHLPLAGSAFKKIYYDVDMGRACAVFVPAEDLVVAYGATDLRSCERFTHVMKKTSNEVRKLQVAGFYRDIDLSEPSPDYSKIQNAYDRIQGDDPSVEYDDRYTLLEMHVDLDLEGYEDMKDGEPTGIACPYVVTIDSQAREILSIRKNWNKDDERKMRRMHFSHYKFMPGLGFYGLGLTHMIGGMAKSATSILRQLVDAGTLSNLPAGLKTRGLRIKGDDSPISPGEFRDVDVPGGSIRDNISFMPYKEPSGTLYQLLGTIVDEARKYAAVPDMNIGEMTNQAPVGSTLAILERSMKVMSACQARLHASLRNEFKILAGVIKDFLPDAYDYEMNKDASRKKDFDERIDVIPVSDPNATTMAQRIMQYQAALQLAQQAPQMYDLPQLHKQMLETLGIQNVDKIIPVGAEVMPEDPVSENMNIINMKPVKAFAYQDHEAHIRTHMSAIQDPKILKLVEQSPNANAIQAALEAHLREHLAFQYRDEIEDQLGVELPPIGEPLPRDVEQRLAGLVAAAAEKLLKKDVAEAQAEENMQKAQDPVVQMQQEELRLQAADIERKAKADQMRVEADILKTQTTAETERKRIASQEKTTGAQIGAKIATESMKAEVNSKETSSKEKIEGAKLGAKIAEDLLEAAEDGSKEES
tara:strand:+ start:5384 stop:7909 length:2526 start_codon:yes stop_codon:yes gene_type:complete